MSHLFRDHTLCIPSTAQVHADLIPHLDSLAELAGWAESGGVCWEGLDNSRLALLDAYNIFTQYERAPVFSAPVFSPDFCAALVQEFSGAAYEVNEAEDVPFQIPELVLKHEALALHGSLAVHFERLLTPMFKALFNMDPVNLRSIQLAKYQPNEVGHGNWHFDMDSDFTAVVALSDTHVGGGTEVKPAGLASAFVVPQLPVGHAMLFPGKTHLHRGLEVTEGIRNLLVFWSEVK